jgi:hypothetical protein
MTKITRGPDQAAVSAEMLDFNERSIGHLQTVSPLDDERTLVGQLVQAEVGELGGVLDAIQIDMRKLHTSRVDPDQLERWAGDRRFRPDASCDATHKGRLSRPKLACQQDHIAGLEALSQAFTCSFGLSR